MFLLKSLEGLKAVNFRKVGKRPEMTLFWETGDPSKESIQQVRYSMQLSCACLKPHFLNICYIGGFIMSAVAKHNVYNFEMFLKKLFNHEDMLLHL